MPVAIHDLPSEQLEHRPQPATRGLIHDPAFVAIINGIVAIATTVSNTM
jgi:hypothetical protein